MPVDTMTILAVDDVDMNLQMIKLMLDTLGELNFLVAKDGRQALDILESTSEIDIILLDLEMPVMNGYELLSIIKQHDDYRDIPVIVITSDKAEVNKTLVMGANDFMAKPYNPEELKLRVLNNIRSKKLNDFARDMNDILEKEIIKKTSALHNALSLSKKAEFEVSLRLGRACEFRDKETGMHIRRISELSHMLAKLAGLNEQECEILRHAATLHDVGKIGIPDSILLKPGKLDSAEIQVMQTHTIVGSNILSESEEYPVLKAGQIVSLQHHEKWDGSGYPNGLSGKDIHIYGRIVMIADVFDALTSERPYKKAFPNDKAVQIMKEGRGSFYDPDLLDIFINNLDCFLHIKEKYNDADDFGGEIKREIFPQIDYKLSVANGSLYSSYGQLSAR
jgi:putative two-component system response regulator